MNKRIKSIILLLFVINFLGTTHLNAQESTSQFIQGTDTLVVYNDVPGLAPSDKYTIRVRSELTNNEWVDVFAHYTYNMATELPPDGMNIARMNFHWLYFTDKWSHTYGNIEMSRNTPVEVEIALKALE